MAPEGLPFQSPLFHFLFELARVLKTDSFQAQLPGPIHIFRNVVDDEFFPSWFYKVPFGDVPLSLILGLQGDYGFIDEPMAVYRQTGKGESTQGRDELGTARFTEKHFLSWIQIWDYANQMYEYSDALRAESGTWTYERLNAFLADPAGTVPGSGMYRGYVEAQTDRVNIIAYLRTLSEAPVSLP